MQFCVMTPRRPECVVAGPMSGWSTATIMLATCGLRHAWLLCKYIILHSTPEKSIGEVRGGLEDRETIDVGLKFMTRPFTRRMVRCQREYTAARDR